MEPDFHGYFRVSVTYFFCLFLGPPCTESLTVETDDVSSGTRDVDPQECLRTLSGRMG